MNINGKFTFTLTEKQDRDGASYLFAGLKFLNAVLFIRQDRNDSTKWLAELKPYTGRPGESEHDSTWSDSENDGQTKQEENNGRKRR